MGNWFNPFAGAGIKDYEKLENLPTINGVEIKGNLSLEDIGLSDLFQIKGRVDTYADLALIEDPEPGWVYLVGLEADPEKEEYVYTDQGTWELIGTAQYVLPAATSNSLGGVMIGDGINVDNSGSISVPIATDQTAGRVKSSTNIAVDASGNMDVTEHLAGNGLEFVSGSRLPSDYTQVEYIHSTGQFIDNAWYPTNGMTKVETVASMSNLANTSLFGNKTYDAGYTCVCGVSLMDMNNEGKYCIIQSDYNTWTGQGVNSNIVADVNTPVTITWEINSPKNQITINGVTFASSRSSTLSNVKSFSIFTGGVGGWCTVADAYLYSMKVYDDNNTLIRDFIPVKNSQNIYGLFDLVNNVFHIQTGGSGSLTGGPPVQNDESGILNVKKATNNEIGGIKTSDSIVIKENGVADIGVSIGGNGLEVTSQFTLPVGYIPVEYLYGTGQCIQNLFYTTPGNIRIETEFASGVPASDEWDIIGGGGDPDWSNIPILILQTASVINSASGHNTDVTLTDYQIAAWVYNIYSISGVVPDINTFHTVIADWSVDTVHMTITVDDVSHSYICNNLRATNLCLFGNGTGGHIASNIKMKYLKIYQDSMDIPAMYLIPVKNSSNVYGMYDLVSGTFFTKTGGNGDFSGGDAITFSSSSVINVIPATAYDIGGVKVGRGLSVTNNGTLSVNVDDAFNAQSTNPVQNATLTELFTPMTQAEYDLLAVKDRPLYFIYEI